MYGRSYRLSLAPSRIIWGLRGRYLLCGGCRQFECFGICFGSTKKKKNWNINFHFKDEFINQWFRLIKTANPSDEKKITYICYSNQTPNPSDEKNKLTNHLNIPLLRNRNTSRFPGIFKMNFKSNKVVACFTLNWAGHHLMSRIHFQLHLRCIFWSPHELAILNGDLPTRPCMSPVVQTSSL